jgi:gamma-glutamylputrescine oxidase
MDSPNTPVWDTGQPLGLPALQGTLEADACVVGLGGSGLACIGELQRLGLRVVGLEARTVAAGAAGRNGGFLLCGTARAYHQTVRERGHNWAQIFYHLTRQQLDLMQQWVPQQVYRNGSLRIVSEPTEIPDTEEQLEAMLADGLTAYRYTGPEGQGLLFPHDGSFNPLEFHRQHARLRLEDGAQLYENSPVLHLDEGRVETAQGQVRAPIVVVAVDGGLDRLLPELSDQVYTVRLQMLATAPLPQRRFNRPVYARWGYEYWQQLPDGRLALGGFRDRAGSAENTHQAEPSQTVQSLLEDFLRHDLGIDQAITHRWAASVGYTHTGFPLLAQARPGVWAIGGYSGTGNLVGALYGRAVAQRAVLGQSMIDALSHT